METVAVKVLDKKKMAAIGEEGEGITHLVNEIRVHWRLSECDGVL
jgi:hypothetical protein